jgi:hypothetical protein
MTANGTPNGEGTVNEDRGERRPERRVHLSEAAELLGVSKDGVRMRVRRGTLRSEKGEDGRVYVWVNVTPEVDRSTLHPEPQVGTWRELIDEVKARVRSLEDANRENQRIIAALRQRTPELEAPRGQEEKVEGRTHPFAGGPQNNSGRPRDTAEFPVHEGSLIGPSWRRVFGG